MVIIGSLSTLKSQQIMPGTIDSSTNTTSSFPEIMINCPFKLLELIRMKKPRHSCKKFLRLPF
jgi:hypothetical protein